MNENEELNLRYLLSISEFAKLNNITSETLRYYDRIGLLKPVYVTKSGRRMYSIRQYERLRTILELRSIGMSLSEIQEYFNNRNLEKSISMLKEYQQRYEKELQRKIEINETLIEKLQFLESFSNLPEMETVFEKEFPIRYMITFGEKSGNREEHAMAFTLLENYIQEPIPIIASDRVGVFSDERLLLPNSEMVSAVPMLIVSPENVEKHYLEKIPGGKYVCMLYKNGILEKYDSCFDKLRDYIKKKGYKISGNILQFYKIDVTLSNNQEETVMEIQIPVQS